MIPPFAFVTMPPISERTATRWLHDLNHTHKQHHKGWPALSCARATGSRARCSSMAPSHVAQAGHDFHHTGQERRWLLDGQGRAAPGRTDLVDLFKQLHPGCEIGLLFDNSSTHGCCAEDALIASGITLGGGPKRCKRTAAAPPPLLQLPPPPPPPTLPTDRRRSGASARPPLKQLPSHGSPLRARTPAWSSQ